jgi:hypothetical protein
MKGGVLLGAMAALLVATAARAEPYLAVREGYNCGGCHTNVTGGGKRSDIVITHPRDILHYPTFLGWFSTPAEPFTGEVNKYIGLGGDLRTSYEAIFQDTPVNGRVDNNEVFRGTLDTNSIDVTEATTYGELRLIPGKLTFYLDQQWAPSVDTREAWAMLRGLPFNSFVKAGKMFLPYGLQLQDDFVYIRGGWNGSATTNYSFSTRQAAFEVGAEQGPYSAVVAVSDGSSDDRDLWVTGTVSAMWTDVPVLRNAFLGVSGAHQGGDSENNEIAIFGGTNLGPLTGLVEVDFLDTRTPTSGGHRGTFIMYEEIDWLIAGWLNVKGAFTYADDDGDLSDRADDSETQVIVALEPFLNRFFQPRILYRIVNGVESNPSHNQSQLLVELHTFF